MRKPQGKELNPSKAKRIRRKLSIRKTIIGTTERPRVCTIKTNKHLVVQVVDDSQNKTLFSVQTFGKNGVGGRSNKDGGKAVGVKVAEKLKEGNFTEVLFDRSGNKYTGVVAAVADAIRESGIKV